MLCPPETPDARIGRPPRASTPYLQWLSVENTTAILTFLLLACSSTAFAQSGRGLMHGYVAFEDMSYNDVAEKGLRASVELRALGEYNETELTTRTDEHGSYDLSAIPMGEYALTISAPGYAAYRTEIYLPSDFECRLAVMMKRENGKGETARPR